MINEQTLMNIVEKARKYDEIRMFPEGRVLGCTFCGKSQNEVARIVRGPNIAHVAQCICDECVELCVEIIEEEGHNKEGKTDKREEYIKNLQNEVEKAKNALETNIIYEGFNEEYIKGLRNGAIFGLEHAISLLKQEMKA